jgi:peptidoglycan hydrolase CwlO-like protein
MLNFYSPFFPYRSSLEEKLESSEALLAEREATNTELERENEVLERKCSRLREYIKKLTAKCEEWAESYDKQARILQRVQGQQQQRSPASSLGMRSPRSYAD